jgi:hypothetical protein
LFKRNGEGYGNTWDSPGASGPLKREALAECKIDLKEPL